jgi:hypothetical protein
MNKYWNFTYLEFIQINNYLFLSLLFFITVFFVTLGVCNTQSVWHVRQVL